MIQPMLCPICRKPATEAGFSPFCSDRCRRVDFFRWWDGRYQIVETADPEMIAGELLHDDPEHITREHDLTETSESF